MKGFAIIATLVFLAVSTGAAKSPEKDTLGDINDFYIDFAVPDPSAFTLLDVSSEAVSRPATPKELGAQFLNAAGDGKEIRSGIALEWAPVQTFEKDIIVGMAEYAARRPWRNLTLSFGTLRDTASARMALGMRWVPWDEGDPLIDPDNSRKIVALLKSDNDGGASRTAKTRFLVRKQERFRKIDSAIYDSKIESGADDDFPSVDPLPDSPQPVLLADSLRNIFLKHGAGLSPEDSVLIDSIVVEYSRMCEFQRLRKGSRESRLEEVLQEFAKGHWNASSLQIGGGMVWASGEFTWAGLEGERGTVYASLALKVGGWGQWIVQPKYSRASDTSGFYDIASLGSRFLAGRNDMRFSVEGLYQFDGSRKESGHTMKATVGMEFRMGEGLWLEVAGGLENPVDRFEDASILSLGSLKYAFREKPRFAGRR